MDNGLYRKLAFVDMSMEQAVLRRLVRSYLLIALAAMLVLLGIAVQRRPAGSPGRWRRHGSSSGSFCRMPPTS